MGVINSPVVAEYWAVSETRRSIDPITARTSPRALPQSCVLEHPDLSPVVGVLTTSTPRFHVRLPKPCGLPSVAPRPHRPCAFGRNAAFVAAIGTSLCDPFPLALKHHVPFKRGNATKHVEH